MRIVAVTSCTSGIAHTYLAKEMLEYAASELDVDIKVETQGANGVEHELTQQDLESADAIIIASDIEIIGKERFKGFEVNMILVNDAVRFAKEVLIDVIEGIKNNEDL